MSTAWIAMKLTDDEVLHGKIPKFYPFRECAICTDTDAAYRFLDEGKDEAYPSVHRLPTVGVIHQVNLDGIALTETIRTSSLDVSQCEISSTSFYVGADKLHNALHMPGSTFSRETIGLLQSCAMNRAAAIAEFTLYQQNAPLGLPFWFRAIAAADPESLHPQVSGSVHVPVYTQALQDIKREYGTNSRLGIDAAVLKAAQVLAQHENPAIAEAFTHVVKAAERALRETAKQHVADFKPFGYLDTIVANMSDTAKTEFLTAYAQRTGGFPVDAPLEHVMTHAAHAALMDMHNSVRPTETPEQRWDAHVIREMTFKTAADASDIKLIEQFAPDTIEKDEQNRDVDD